MSAFNPSDPATWTWDTLKAWLMARGRTPAEVRAALRREGAARFRRLAYQLRMQARLNRLEGEAAKRKFFESRR